MNALYPYLTSNSDLFQLQVKQPTVTTRIRSYINSQHELSIKTSDKDQCYEFLGTRSDFGPNKVNINNVPIHIFSDENNLYGCNAYTKKEMLLIQDKILLVSRGKCNFLDKVINAQQAGAKAIIFLNNKEGEHEFRISTDDTAHSSIITIPSLIISYNDALSLLKTNRKQLTTLQINQLPSIDNDPDAIISLLYRGKRIKNVVIINL
ncbi:hypothetical protein EDC94DRAFT_629478 [Helicostylum pulchrum]|uniref:PA domain-containing protein n=1 Tax=Helicostylum pulchrum TaxID=562976 RepID=A0ABP9Y2M5_9FUNG|nr:hypothetical protein EDC94DRAFT_629478 [Helicostylum pulchrum]